MTLTPRQDRIRVLLTRMERLDRELITLLEAEYDDPPTTADVRSYTSRRQAEARAWLLEWAETAEFRARIMRYGKAS